MISKVPSVDEVCIALCRMENFTMSKLLDHVLFMVTQAAMNDVPPRSNDEFGLVHASGEAIKQGKDIHIFRGSGTGLILEGLSGYTYQMQRSMDLPACKSFGTCRSNPCNRAVFVKPAPPNTVMATNTSSMKEMMAHLNLESSNSARLLSINSSSNNFMLRTFLSSTETVKVQEEKDDMIEGTFSNLRHSFSFQCVTKLQNFICCNQVGEMKRCFLSRRQTVASERGALVATSHQSSSGPTPQLCMLTSSIPCLS